MDQGSRPFLSKVLDGVNNLGWSRWVKVGFWIVGAVVVAAISHQQFIPLWNEYTNQDANMITEASISESVTAPSLVVCIPYYNDAMYSAEKWSAAMKNRPRDIWDLNYTDYAQLGRMDRAKIVNRVLEEGDGYPSLMLNESGYNWNQPIVDTVWQYLSDITETDREAWYLESRPDYTELIRPVSNEDINKLFQLVLASMFMDGASSNDYENPIYEYYMLQSNEATIIDDHLCFLWNSNRDGTSGDENTVSSYRLMSPPVKTSTSNIIVFPDASIMYSDTASLSSYNSIPLYETLPTIDATSITTESVTLSYSVQSKYIQKDDCGLDAPTKCAARRRVNASMEYCKCFPFAYRYLDANSNSNNLPYCNRSHYRSCKENLTHTAVQADSYCKRECERTTYSWMRDSAIETTGNATTDGRTFRLQLRHLRTSYPTFKIADKATIYTLLLSHLGGLVGLLGFSALAIIFVICLIIDCVCAYRKESVARNERTRVYDEIDQFKGEVSQQLEAVKRQIGFVNGYGERK